MNTVGLSCVANYLWAEGPPLRVVDAPSDIPLYQTDFPFANGYRVQWLLGHGGNASPLPDSVLDFVWLEPRARCHSLYEIARISSGVWKTVSLDSSTTSGS